MTIRTRLALWSGGVMLTSLSLMAGLSYWEFVGRRAETGPWPAVGARHPHDEARPAEHPIGARPRDPRGRRPDGRRNPFGEVREIVLRVAAPALLMSLVGGWWLMRRSLAPLQALTQAVERTNEQTLREQLPRSGNGDELDRLTEVFNAMTLRLDESFQRIRDFTLHASHELKTPLTVMQGEIETACRDAALADIQRDMLLSQLDEVRRLASIVDSLSLLAKADAGQVTLTSAPVELADLVNETIEDLQHLGLAQQLTVTLEACEPVTVLGDRHRLRQMLLNLADNAVKYNVAGGYVRLALRRRTTEAEIVMVNSGPGLPDDAQTRVFDRFFRGEANLHATVDGSGLGLSIVQWIVEAHEGSVSFASTPGGQTTLTVRIPIRRRGGGPDVTPR